MLPPRAVRRLLGPAVLVGLVLAVPLLPALSVLAAAASRWLPGRWRALRLLWFALIYVGLQLAGVLAGAALWLASGGGWRLRDERFRQAHYTVLRVLLELLLSSARRLFKLTVVTDGQSWSPLDDGVPGSTNAMVVLSRHAGPGDSLLLVSTLMNRDHLRRPRIVLTEMLQLDPVIDLYLNRLPNRFLRPGPDAGRRAVHAVGELARDLGEEDALLIFPEGGNFTTRRRARAITRLRERGHDLAADRAEAMANLLPPRPGGVDAALTAAPHADVVFVAHTGLEHLNTVRDIWRELPMDKTLHLRWWFIPAAEVPGDPDSRIDWLYGWWATIDSWITETRAAAEQQP